MLDKYMLVSASGYQVTTVQSGEPAQTEKRKRLRF